MTWLWRPFSELSNLQVYELIQLRERVFVLEQNCVYLDCDGLDPLAWQRCIIETGWVFKTPGPICVQVLRDQ